MKYRLGLLHLLIATLLGCASQSGRVDSVAGKYVAVDDSSHYFELKSNGTFYEQKTNSALTGTYTASAGEVVLTTSLGLAAKAELIGDSLLILNRSDKFRRHP